MGDNNRFNNTKITTLIPLNQGVQGSNPCRRTKREKEYFSLFFLYLTLPD